MHRERELVLRRLAFLIKNKYGFSSSDNISLDVEEVADGLMYALNASIFSLSDTRNVDVKIEVPKTIFDWFLFLAFKGKIKFKTKEVIKKLKVNADFVSDQFNFPVITNKTIIRLNIEQDGSVNILDI